MKKILSRVITGFIWIGVIFLVILVLSSKASDGEPSFFGYKLMAVLSGSMEPTFDTGSAILIKLSNDSEEIYEEGDVITFNSDGSIPITHRITEVVISGGEYVLYTTKGDNNNTEDSDQVLAENVIGKYTGFTIPHFGRLMLFSKTRLGSSLFLLIPGFILLGYSIYYFRRGLSQLENIKKNESASQ